MITHSHDLHSKYTFAGTVWKEAMLKIHELYIYTPIFHDPPSFMAIFNPPIENLISGLSYSHGWTFNNFDFLFIDLWYVESFLFYLGLFFFFFLIEDPKVYSLVLVARSQGHLLFSLLMLPIVYISMRTLEWVHWNCAFHGSYTDNESDMIIVECILYTWWIGHDNGDSFIGIAHSMDLIQMMNWTW